MMIKPKRGEIWIVDFDPTTGREQKGTRPAVVMSSDLMDVAKIQLVFVVPGTTTARTNSHGMVVPNHLPVSPSSFNKLDRQTFFMVEQLKSISISRLSKRLGALTTDELGQLEEIATLLLDLGPK